MTTFNYYATADDNPDLPNPTKGVSRWEANMGALRTLHTLEAEGREATEAERRTLEGYSGFGGAEFGEAFNLETDSVPWRRRGDEAPRDGVRGPVQRDHRLPAQCLLHHAGDHPDHVEGMVETARTYGKSDAELKDYARRYSKECQNTTYPKLAKAGELEAHLQSRADAARQYAEDLISKGEFPPQAWHWAIRL